MIIGTAGHVDHGKTTLIKALTGTDCDRLDEERRRGITIALGFAQWCLEGPEGAPMPVSVIDVPGHERLVQTMLSGAGGMDGVLLAVSATAGVMPQTREHLAACELLGVERGVVAMTFADKVEDVDAAAARIRVALSGSLLADAPIIPVSAPTGEGLEALTEAASALLRDAPPRHALGLVRMPVDRVFTIVGAGTVVTGSLLEGTIYVGDTLNVSPSGASARVRGIEVHGEAADSVEAGHRVALNLQLKRGQISRGAILSAPGLARLGRVLDVRLRWCRHAPEPLTRQRGLVLHSYGLKATAEVRADAPIPPGGEGTARVRLDRALPLLPGGRFVLRGAPDKTYGAVIGGGQILDTSPPRRRLAEIREALAQDARAALPLILRESGRGGLGSVDVPRRFNTRATWRGLRFHGEVVASEAARLVAAVEAHHATHPDLQGAPRPEFSPLAREAESNAIQAGVLERVGPLLRLPGHEVEVPRADKQMAHKLIRALGKLGLDGATPAELARRFQRSEADIKRALRLLEARERLIISEGHCLPIREATEAREELEYHLAEGVQLRVRDVRQRFGVSRGAALALLAWLDREGVSRRVNGLRLKGPALGVG